MEPQIGAQTPRGGIQRSSSLGSHQRSEMSKEEKTSPLLPPSIKVMPWGCQAGSEGWGHTQPAASLGRGGLTRRLLAPRRQRAFKLKG